MNKALKKIISCFLIFAFLFNIALPIKDAHAMTAPWWSGSQAYGTIGIAPPPPGESGNNQKNNEESGDPIFIHNGELIYRHQDFLIPSRGMNTEINRTYKSQSRYNNRFGFGWDIFYNKRIIPLCTGDLQYLDGKLNRYTFTYINGTDYTSPQGVYDTLVQNPDGTFTLTEPHKTTYTFDQNGVLTQIKDRNNNTLTFTYDPQGELPIIGISPYSNDPDPGVIAYDYKLLSITDTVGRQISFGYDDNGRLATITDFSGRVYTYSYDPSVNGDLLSFTTPPTTEYPQGLTTTYTYQDHNLQTITDAKNQTYLTNYYDSSDRVYQQNYGQGQFSLSYDTANNKTTVTDPKGFVVEWTYDANGNPLSKKEFTQGLRPTDPPYYTTTYTYNNNLERTQITYPEGNGIKYTFDESNPNQLSRGNLLEIRRKPDMSQPDNNQIDIVTTFTYTADFNMIHTITDPEGNLTTYNYDTNGNLTSIVYPQVGGQTPQTLFTYNQYGQLETVTDPNNNLTRYEYYADTGYLWKIRQDPNGLNYITQFAYDPVGNPQSITNARGHTTTFEYNALNQLKKTIAPLPFNYETKYSYDENGNLKKLERQTNDPTNPWQTTEYTYTQLDQLETIKQYTGPTTYLTTSFSYDLNGNRHTITDPEQNTTTYDYDERNLIWKATDALTHVTEYSYDHNGNQEVIKDANNHSATYNYDNFDRLQTTTYDDDSFKHYTYDKNSNLLTQNTNDDPQTQIAYDYDALNRLDFKTYPDASIVDYGYDLGSRLTSIQNPVSSISYIYNAVNRIESTTQTVNSQPYTVNYQYDPVGNRTQLTYPSGYVLNYSYDELNRLTTITPPVGRIFSYTYDALSRRTKIQLPNRTFSTYTYDWLNRLTNIANKTYNIREVEAMELNIENINQEELSIEQESGEVGNSQDQGQPGEALTDDPTIINPGPPIPVPLYRIISGFGYTYDDAGNRLSMTTRQGTDNYGYDNIYQLTTVSGTQTHSYQYDDTGNRELVDGIIYTPNNLNQYEQVGGTNYQYDPKGNLTNDGVHTFGYDYENRLISAVGNGNNATYNYDGFGRRISKTVNGTTTYFIYDSDRIIEERSPNGSLLANYTFGTGIDEVLKMTRGGNDYYYHYDGLGSVRNITNSASNVVESYSYDVYGQPSQLSTIGNRFYFTGREFDSESGLYYLRNRYYNPIIGRFLQRDPITWGPDDLRSLSFSGADYETDKAIAKGLGLDDKIFNANLKLAHSVPSLINRVGANNPSLLHLYLYAINNPVNWIDPFGFDKEPEPPSVEEEALIPVPIWEDPSFWSALGGVVTWKLLGLEITIFRGPNIFKIISRTLRKGFRIDKPEISPPKSIHRHIWRW